MEDISTFPSIYLEALVTVCQSPQQESTTSVQTGSWLGSFKDGFRFEGTHLPCRAGLVSYSVDQPEKCLHLGDWCIQITVQRKLPSEPAFCGWWFVWFEDPALHEISLHHWVVLLNRLPSAHHFPQVFPRSSGNQSGAFCICKGYTFKQLDCQDVTSGTLSQSTLYACWRHLA